ncbi:hypothetical protein [Thermomonospora catenispora]|uniref:hypothetical protein n=1 Tax=Thermomonospora catenispora TaxID=2493090 RepID=UPI00240E0D94|nr:hypothetical protein [Thermomonospora catenispora]
MTGPIVVAEGLYKRFGDVRALRGLDLTVPPGAVCALLGPNGSGQTIETRDPKVTRGPAARPVTRPAQPRRPPRALAGDSRHAARHAATPVRSPLADGGWSDPC